ncbi:helix-turn-helix domain-containing protein [Janthinobacterium sp. LB3P118]|uniref:helix-turn-helix domain-containing protein n=1 Tax=Janthinobacterium sp. LB3P118 TaxID=3424195 RepID=UPI003F29C481
MSTPLPKSAIMHGHSGNAGHSRTVAARQRTLHRLFQKQTGSKVIDVAIDNGYTSQSALTAMFKKHFGITPTTFYQAKVIAG